MLYECSEQGSWHFFCFSKQFFVIVLPFFLLLIAMSLCLYCADILPYSIRYLLESAIRNCDNFQVLKADVEKILDWEITAPKQVEIPFKPARVILQVLSFKEV
jgi:hypothetical protein